MAAIQTCRRSERARPRSTDRRIGRSPLMAHRVAPRTRATRFQRRWSLGWGRSGAPGEIRTPDLLIRSRNKRECRISNLGMLPSTHQRVRQISTYSAVLLFSPVFSPSMSKGRQSHPKTPELDLVFGFESAHTEMAA